MKRSALIALILVYLSMVATAIVSRQTFDRLPHLEDEFAYLFQARIFEHGDAYIPTPQPERAYWQPFVINHEGKRFGKYPPGYPLLLAIGAGMNVPWVINLWMTGLTVALVYRFARELYDETAGIVAALLLTTSPIALLLNGTLMSHTSAMFFGTLFLYSLWQLERGRNLLMWGEIAGASLGMLIAMRPLTAAGFAIPLVLYSGLRLLWVLIQNYAKYLSALQSELEQVSMIPLITRIVRMKYPTFNFPRTDIANLYSKQANFLPTLNPLLMVAAFTLVVGALYPAFNYVTTGDPTANLYTLVWAYDRAGFGEGHGRYQGEEYVSYAANGVKVHMQTHAGHSPQRGWKTVKKDAKCYFRDLFGWVGQPDDPPNAILSGNGCLVDQLGYSWILLPFGVILMTRRKWSLILLVAAGSIILVNITYWIGAEVYSARYFYEATAAFAIVSGAGLSGLARNKMRYGVYALLGILVAMSVITYTPRRLEPLQGYGHISRDPIEEVEKMRYTPNTPVLVIASGDQHWRAIGPFMALTDPYATNEIIGLRDPEQLYSDDLINRYPERQIIFLVEDKLIPVDIPGQAGYNQDFSAGQ
jgi:Dolichyl-phosphate-mannose-protein mannosyltransferase